MSLIDKEYSISDMIITTGLNWVVNFGPAAILGLGSPDCVMILSMVRMTLIRSGPCVCE